MLLIESRHRLRKEVNIKMTGLLPLKVYAFTLTVQALYVTSKIKVSVIRSLLNESDLEGNAKFYNAITQN